jgi:hypothetical protein
MSNTSGNGQGTTWIDAIIKNEYFRCHCRVLHIYPSFLMGYSLESLPNLHSNAVKRCVSIFWIVKGNAFHEIGECVHTNKVYMATAEE